MGNENLRDPIQGFDVEVTVSDYGTGSAVLVGRFTSILVRVVNVTETYLELNQRMPRHLDGEINIVWQMERGMLNTKVLEDTFGFFSGSAGVGADISRSTNRIKRAKRFTIDFRVKTAPSDFADQGMQQYNDQVNSSLGTSGYRLSLCKTDTMSFGATSGRNIVANQWQGTAEGIQVI